MIKLQITKHVDNPNYEDELAKMNDRAMHRHNEDMPQKSIPQNAMEVMITEEQFDAIRKAVLEKF